MEKQGNKNYEQIAAAIEYVNANCKNQLDLDEVAKSLKLSSANLERLFIHWAGVSAGDFFRSINVGYVRKTLEPQQINLFESPAGRQTEQHLYEADIQQMTLAEYKNGGSELIINYSYADCHFGKLLIAATPKGVCNIAFYEEEQGALKLLSAKFPKASYIQQSDLFQEQALIAFQTESAQQQAIQLHLKGTQFQLKVWEALLKIPMGELSTYGELAKNLGNPNASRAVGTAIGLNPIAFLIPCHRVIQATGNFGGYMWGMTRKKAMIGWEQAFCSSQ